MVDIELTMNEDHCCLQLIVVDYNRFWLAMVDHDCSCLIMVDHGWP